MPLDIVHIVCHLHEYLMLQASSQYYPFLRKSDEWYWIKINFLLNFSLFVVGYETIYKKLKFYARVNDPVDFWSLDKTELSKRYNRGLDFSIYIYFKNLFGEGHKNRPNYLIRAGFGGRLEVQIQKFAHSTHRQFIVVVVERCKCILQHITGMREKDERQHPFVHTLRIIYPFG